MTKRRLWLLTGLAVWAVLLGALAVVSHRRDAPTVREQRTLAQALPVVDEAVGRLLAGAGDDAVPVIVPRAIERGCRITPMRDGATATGMIRFYTADAPGLLDRLGAALPPAYEATVTHRGTSHALDADAGEFVAVRGRIPATGEVQVVVTTGCRPPDVEAGDLLPATAFDDEPGRVLTALAATSVEPATSTAAPCPTGGVAETATALGHGIAPSPPPATALGTPPGTVEIVNTPKVYAYRQPDGLAVAVIPGPASGDARVSVTRGC